MGATGRRLAPCADTGYPPSCRCCPRRAATWWWCGNVCSCRRWTSRCPATWPPRRYGARPPRMVPMGEDRVGLVAWSRYTYDALAPAYAAANQAIRSGLRRYADRLLEHVGAGLVLEAGCGAGRDLRYL